MIFLFRRIKREFSLITCNLPLVIFAAFLCAFGGIVLWVSGGSTWFVIRGGANLVADISLTAVFCIWLIVYGLVGVVLAMIWLLCRARIMPQKASLCAFGIIMAAYLLMQNWYAVFFCTRLIIFSGILLSLSVIACGIVIVITRKSVTLLSLIILIIEMIQIYFLRFCFL